MAVALARGPARHSQTLMAVGAGGPAMILARGPALSLAPTAWTGGLHRGIDIVRHIVCPMNQTKSWVSDEMLLIDG